MELEKNHIDDVFRHRLRDAEVPPPPFVWTNVERALHRRKRRRFFLWLFAFGMAGAGLWAMLYWPLTRTSTIVASEQGPEIKREIAAEAENPDHTAPYKTESTSQNAAEPGEQLKVPATKAGLQPRGVESVTSAERGGIQRLPDNKPENATTDPPSAGDTYLKGAVEGFSPLTNAAAEPLIFRRENKLPQAKIFIRKKKDPKYCYDFTQNPNVWMLDAYAGPSFNKRELETADPAYNDYAQMRRSTEQSDWSYNAGLRGSLLLGRHFLLRTGLHYEQRTEVFEYADPDYVKYIVVIINQPGEPTIIDTVGVEYGENYVKTYNRYGMLDVPLEIGGELRRGRFGMSINAGMSFNVLFWKRGTILSPGGHPTPFTPGAKGATEVFRPRTGWSAGASAQLFFHLQPTIRVFAEPYYRQILKPVTLDNQPVEQRYRNWGIKMGVTRILD